MFRSSKFALIALGFAALGVTLAVPAHAQTQILDSSALHPPAGARVAIVEFDDLQCPACAAANPDLKAAAAKYHIPWVRHDFLIPMHNWSRFAAINARWFDEKQKGLGDEYRDEVFAAQSTIYNPGALNQFTQQFAQAHHIQMPFAIDPQGKLADEVKRDTELAQRTGLHSTPSVFIVMSGSSGPPYIQVANPATQLYSDIDQAMADTAQEGRAAARKTVH